MNSVVRSVPRSVDGGGPVVTDAGEVVADISTWLQKVAGAFAPADLDAAAGEFSGRMRTFARDGVRLSRTASTRHMLRRTPRHVAARGGSQFVLCLHLEGRAAVIQDGRSADLGPGDATIYDTSRPYTLAMETDFSCLGVVVPSAALPFKPGVMESLTATTLSGKDPLTAVVVDGIRDFEGRMAQVPALAQGRLTGSIVDLIETLCMHHGVRLGVFGGDARSAQLEQVARYIDENLADPDLDPQRVAAANFMSVRSLHALAHESGVSIASRIRRARLAHCKEDLSNPALAHLSVSEVGARWGLVRAPHFTKLFRDEYGATPSAFRQSLSA